MVKVDNFPSPFTRDGWIMVKVDNFPSPSPGMTGAWFQLIIFRMIGTWLLLEWLQLIIFPSHSQGMLDHGYKLTNDYFNHSCPGMGRGRLQLIILQLFSIDGWSMITVGWCMICIEIFKKI
jgi:hypothetical protein